MPRKKRKRSKPPAVEEDYKSHSSSDIPDSGETISVDQAPEGASLLEDDSDDSVDPWGDPDGLDNINPQTTPAPMPPIPPPPGSQPDIQEYERPKLTNAEFGSGDYVLTDPITVPNVVNDKRVHLTWIVNDVSIRYINENDMPRPEICLKAILCACTYELVPIEEKGRREPILGVQRLFNDPVDMVLPLWLFPPELLANPNLITLERAEKALAQLFTSFPTEIIKPAPPPAAKERIPDWLLREMAKKGGQRE